MVSFGGFYLSPTMWSEYLKAQHQDEEYESPAYAAEWIRMQLNTAGLLRYVGVRTVPIPDTDAEHPLHEEGYHSGVFLYRIRNDTEREYLGLNKASAGDVEAKARLEKVLGIQLPEWSSLYYKEYSKLEPLRSEYLSPSDT